MLLLGNGTIDSVDQGSGDDQMTVTGGTGTYDSVNAGDRTVTVQDYYAEGCPDVTIELDPRKSPQENAAAQVEGAIATCSLGEGQS